MASAIIWQEKFLPGTTDNFVSNEVIVKDITVDKAWALLVDITQWPLYYHNVEKITPPASGPTLEKGDTFTFGTFGFYPIHAEVCESTPPEAGAPGRLAWRAWCGEGEGRLEVYHAWLVEGLSWGVVRVLTQESQVGVPAVEMAAKRPDVMLNGHMDWLDGLVAEARKRS